MNEPTAFDILSALLKPYAKDMIVKHDTETNYYLEETISSDKPQMFCAAQVKKSYTSFHVFPVCRVKPVSISRPPISCQFKS